MSRALIIMSDSPVDDNKGSHPVKKSAVFFNIVQKAFDPIPLPFEHLVDFFLTDWEALCTALRLETMSSIS